MDIGTVKAHIKSGQFDDFYIFAGDELEIMGVYIKKIAEKGNYRLEVVDNLSTVLTRIKMKSILSVPTLYLIYDDKEFLKEEKLWDRVKNLKNDLVIFQFTSVDGRLKFWKNFQNRAVMFEHLDNRILTKYIHKQLGEMSDKCCERLIEICENDYGRILLEIDKIKRMWQYQCTDMAIDEVFEKLIAEGTIYVPPKDAIFDLVAAVMERKPKKVFRLLAECRGVGEADLVIITVLYDNLRNLLQVQTATGDSISKSTGLNGFQVKLVQPYVDNYLDEELVAACKLLRSMERGIKVGEVESAVAVDYSLLSIL